MKGKKVKIGAYTWRYFENLKDEKLCGLTTCDPPKIEIRKSLDPNLKAVAVFHELFHAALFSAGITFLGRNQEETVVDNLATLLLMFIKEKPGFVKHLDKLVKGAK